MRLYIHKYIHTSHLMLILAICIHVHIELNGKVLYSCSIMWGMAVQCSAVQCSVSECVYLWKACCMTPVLLAPHITLCLIRPHLHIRTTSAYNKKFYKYIAHQLTFSFSTYIIANLRHVIYNYSYKNDFLEDLHKETL